MKQIFTKEGVIHLLKNRWFLSGIAFIVIILFGTHSVIKLSNYRADLAELKEQQKQLEERIRLDSINTIKMQKDIKFIEKFAREKYMMKKDNEDIYIIKEEK
ncbi:MAG: septum formation initiator family protein [Bacteroidales bacterium]|jgi:cell division protein FtsB|nr:septum formation initiator family protein [Bacteroidales bacterium]